MRHSSLAVPGVQLSWQQVVDEEPLPIRSDPAPKIFYDPEAVLGLIYTSGTTGAAKRRHAHDPEARAYTAYIVGCLFGHAHLTNSRCLALLGDADADAYEILVSFSSPGREKPISGLNPRQ